MLEKVKNFNAQYNGTPAKVAGAIIGAILVGGVALAVYNYTSYDSFIDVEVHPEVLEDVAQTTVEAVKGN